MKQRLVALAVVLFSLGVALQAAGPEEEYVQIFNQIQEADRLAQNQRLDQARAAYLEAQTNLGNLSRQYPDWNPNIVRFRLGYIARKLAAISSDPTAAPAPAPAARPEPAPTVPDAASDLQAEQTRERLRQLEREKNELSARLREALAARPAAVDPQELAAAEARILAQQKEIELLKVSLEKSRSDETRAPDPALEATRQALADAQQQLARQTEQIATLTLERSALQQRLLALVAAPANQPEPAPATATPAPGGVGEADLLKQQLRSLQQQLSEEQARNQVLVAERQVLEKRLTDLPARSAESELANRIRNLEKELEIARQSTGTDAATISALQTALTSANQQISALQRQVRDLQPQSSQARLEAMLDPEARPSPAAVVAGETSPASPDPAGGQLTEMQARLAMLEARRVPYSPEELALFSVPEISAATNQLARANSGLSRDTALLIAEAEKDLRAGRFSEAEQKYQQALATDRNNVVLLSSLASAQVEQGDPAQAEKTIGQALAGDPNDAFSLFVLGRVRYEQGRVDEAMTALSRSAHLDGSRAETFNLLGIALGRLGLREPAETALRRAVQIAPGYASAHHNLAVIYSSQSPPSMGLARWHYEKAVAGGHRPDPALEARLKGAVSP
jgi:Tfp pilus assembly protein PilF